MGKLTNLNPPPPLGDSDIPAAIARDAEVTAAINAHLGATDPHTQYLLQAEGDARYRQSSVALTDSDIPAAIARDAEVTAAINAHVTATDPHAQYLVQSEGDSRYRQLALSETFTPSLKITATSGVALTNADNTFPVRAGLEIQEVNTNAGAFFLFHRPGVSGFHFGIDPGFNNLAIGGWSYGVNSYRVWHGVYGIPVWQTPSDKRLKEGIRPIVSALALILECKPVSFRYNKIIRDKKDFLADTFQRDKIHYGFLANEFPLQDLVSEKENGYLGLDYLEAIPFLFRAIQELDEKITLLKAEIELLKA